MAHGGARPNAGRKSKAEEAGLKALLDECVTERDRRALFRKLKQKALAGEDVAMGLLLGYLYGKPVQRQEITGAEGEPLFKVYVGVDPDAV
jgi:hypothetical protein